MTEQIRRLYSGYPSMTVTLTTEHQLRNMEFLNFESLKLKSKRQEHLIGEH